MTTKTSLQAALAVVGVFGGYGLARYTDGLVRIFLRQRTGEAFLSAMARNWRMPEAAAALAWAVGVGLCLWLGLVWVWAWRCSRSRSDATVPAARALTPLWVVVVMTGLACLSLTLSPQFPYGLNLALSLTYEGVFAQVLAWGLVVLSVVHGFLHFRGPLPRRYLSDERARRLRTAGAVAAVVVATVVFASVTPPWFWEDGQGQGNMFKYVRMAAALTRSGTLDIAKADGAGEQASFTHFLSLWPHMARSAMSEAAALASRVAGEARKGRLYLGRLEARRANRAMYRSHRGGIYYIHAPGPGWLVVPAYLLDRALNRLLGWKRQFGLILWWNVLGGLLFLEMIRLARPVAGEWPAAVVSAAALAASPPLWLYTFQVYPELPAALGLVYAFRKLWMEDTPSHRGILAGSLALAFLPWLHQKYSVVAATMGLMAAWRLLRAKGGGFGLRLLVLGIPLSLSAAAILVYNHALTGTIVPGAAFRAVGRTSFEPQHMLRGLLGLALDAENGLFVYAPVYLLTFVSLRWFTRHYSRLYTGLLLVVVAYVVVIASFPHWPGAVSSVARYILSVAPFAVLLLAPLVRRAFSDGVLAGAALALFAASLSISVSFHQDIVHSYQPALFLSRAWFCDPHQYLPSFLSEGFLGSGSAHLSKLTALLVAVGALVGWLSPRMDREPALYEHDARLYPRRSGLGAVGVVGLLVLGGGVLEHLPWNPTEKTGPTYRRSLPLRRGSPIVVFAEGRYGFEQGGVWVPGGARTRFLISSPRPLVAVRLSLVNVPRPNRIEITRRGSPSLELELAPSDRLTRLVPLKSPWVFHGPKGDAYVYQLSVFSGASFVPSKEGQHEDSRRLGCYVVLK